MYDGLTNEPSSAPYQVLYRACVCVRFWMADAAAHGVKIYDAAAATGRWLHREGVLREVARDSSLVVTLCWPALGFVLRQPSIPAPAAARLPQVRAQASPAAPGAELSLHAILCMLTATHFRSAADHTRLRAAALKMPACCAGSISIPAVQLPSALQVPGEEFQRQYRTSRPHADDLVVVYSRTHTRAAWAAQVAADAGLHNCFVLLQVRRHLRPCRLRPCREWWLQGRHRAGLNAACMPTWHNQVAGTRCAGTSGLLRRVESWGSIM